MPIYGTTARYQWDVSRLNSFTTYGYHPECGSEYVHCYDLQ
mgnify:CR=1 FL=1